MDEDCDLDLKGLVVPQAELNDFGPFYLRTLKKLDWIVGDAPLDERVVASSRKVFDPTKGHGPRQDSYSFFKIASLRDLTSVLGAMLGRRGGKPNNVDGLFFTGDELQDAKLEIELTGGLLGCGVADELHLTVSPMEGGGFDELCRIALGKGRKVRRFAQRKEAKRIMDEQRRYGCEAFFENTGNCRCR